MGIMKRVTRRCFLIGALTLAGCAPVASTWSTGPGLQAGINPSGRLKLSNAQCSLMGVPGVGESPLTRNASAAGTVTARMQQVSRIQWSFMKGLQSMADRRDGWKSIASGGC